MSAPQSLFQFLVYHRETNNVVAEFDTREEAEAALAHWENCEVIEMSGDDLQEASQEEDLVVFAQRLRQHAEDWRKSDEFIGIVVRSRWSQRYDLG